MPINLDFFIVERPILKQIIHERSLRILYKDNISSFEELLKKDKSFCNIHSLVIEPFLR